MSLKAAAILILIGSSVVLSAQSFDAKQQFQQKCAMCHGADGKGKPAMKTRDWSSADVQKMSDADLAAIITNGKSPMPAYKTMTADQVKDMVAYVRTFKK